MARLGDPGRDPGRGDRRAARDAAVERAGDKDPGGGGYGEQGGGCNYGELQGGEITWGADYMPGRRVGSRLGQL